MFEWLAGGATVVAVVLLIVAIYYHEVAALNAAWISIYAEDAADAQNSAEEIERHCAAWEDRATMAEAQLAEMTAERDSIRALYADWVRKTLGNSIVLVRVEKDVD